MLVLGVDPGTATTGYGVVRAVRPGEAALVECGVIRTKARDPLASRLKEIHDGIEELIARHKPAVLSVEAVFYAKNVRTTVVLGHARGVILPPARSTSCTSMRFPRPRSRRRSPAPVRRRRSRCSSCSPACSG